MTHSTGLFVAKSATELYLLPRMANRPGLVADATGTGKTVTLQVLAEAFSSDGDRDEGRPSMGRRVLSTLMVLAMVFGLALGGTAGCTPKDVVSEDDAGGAASGEPTTGPTEEGPPCLEVTETVIPPDAAAILKVPTGTTLNSASISNGVAKVDLSDEFDDGGGTLSVTMRLAQVVYTLCQFPTVDSVEFYMDGEKVEVFTGEGLMLDGPQTPEDYYSLIPVDA